MKNIYFTILLLSIVLNANSQAVLEHIYTDQSVNSVKLQNQGWCYYSLHFNMPITDVKIYNINHSLIKTIPLHLPTGSVLYTLNNVSDVLFNDDSKIEVLYSVADFTQNPPQFQSFVIDENGDVIQTLPNIYYSNIINQEGTYKMISISPYDSSTYVYNLPGTLFSTDNIDDSQVKAAYPNPCSDFISIPSLLNSISVKIIDMKGIQQYFSFLNGSGIRTIDTKTFPSGSYAYEILLANGKKTSGKFSVIR